MRAIKFRGKPIEDVDFDNIGVHISKDDFVYGNLIVDGYQAWIVKGVIESTNDYITLEQWIPVDKETIGQSTGLHDKNGVEIYEGDVMHWDSHWGWYVGYENGAFRRIPLNDIQRINWRHHTLQQEGLDTWEIIGNIHEEVEE